ncbi:MAG: alginate export family protein [Myxococcales bacterium]|nr:alginate export family protein [Myxococcales bacterium]
MRRRRFYDKTLVLFLCLVAAPAVAWADGAALSTSLVGGRVQLDFRGQYRARFLFNTGKDFKVGNNSETVAQRARFGMSLSYMDRLSFFFQVQDVRTWGEEKDTLGTYNANGFDLHQAFGQVRIVDRLFVRIGRQELSLDNERLIGAVDWSMQARSFDGIRIYYDRDPYHATIFYAKVGEEHALNNVFKRDRDLGVVHFRYSRLPYFEPSMLYVIDTDYAEKRVRHTMGVHLTGEVKGLNYTGEFYGQFGEVGDKTIKAFMGAVLVGYTIPHRLLRVNLGFDAWFEYLSGDRNPNDGDSKSFDTLFATNHRFYGYMDFFLNIPNDTINRGLMDIGGRIRLAPVSGMVIKVDYHYFQAPRRFSSGEVYLGSEVDVLVSYKVWRYLKLDAVYGVFIPHAAMKALKGSGNEHLFYLTTDFQF